MRNELNDIKLIEKYLMNQLNDEERRAFESRMNNDADFRKDVELQRQLIEGLKLHAMKIQIKKAKKQYHSTQNLFRYGLGGLGASGIVLTVGMIINSQNSDSTKEVAQKEIKKDVKHHLGEEYTDVNEQMPSNYYTLDVKDDTLLISPAGILLSVPENAFVDENGNPVQGEVILELKEALNATDIMNAGLSTTSNGELLETGGMFYIQPWQNGKKLDINKRNPIIADVPGNPNQPGMMLFDGEIMPDGQVNWVNPKSLEKFLTPVDILTMDFYPPAYLQKVSDLGKNAGDSRYTDSLYYSFAGECGAISGSDTVRYFNEESTGEVNRNRKRKGGPSMSEQYPADTVSSSESTAAAKSNECSCIDPSKIRAIKNSQFNGSLLATVEFGQRVPAIHRSCKGEVLDLYVNNLDKNLWEVDSMASKIASNGIEFSEFAKLRQGRSEGQLPQIKMLQDFYLKQQKAYADAAKKVRDNYYNQQQQLVEKYREDSKKSADEEYKRELNVFVQEFNMNLDNMMEQLGYVRIRPGFNVAVTTPGFKNIDRYVLESTAMRKTMSFTDPSTGKKAEIKYEKVSFQIDDEGFDRVYVYLLPDKLNSFNRVQKRDGLYSENLNEILAYDMLAVGWKGIKPYYTRLLSVKPGNYPNLKWLSCTADELKEMMNTYNRGSQKVDLQKDISVWMTDLAELKRSASFENAEHLRSEVKFAIFPCCSQLDTYIIYSNTDAGITKTIKKIKAKKTIQ